MPRRPRHHRSTTEGTRRSDGCGAQPTIPKIPRIPGFFGVLGLLLVSCSAPQASQNGLRHGVAPERLTASLELNVLAEEGSLRTIGIVVRNPERVPLQSVRSWILFDPAVASVSDLSISDDRFILFAPGERTIDAPEGFVKLGGAAREPITDGEILFATFTLRLAPPLRAGAGLAQGERNGNPVLSFYDWRAGGDGHTAVLSVEDGVAVNVLQVPSPLQL